jgi:hypothetical protein
MAGWFADTIRRNALSSFEMNYDPDALHSLTSEERAKLRELHRILDEHFAKVSAAVAKQLGYDEQDPRAATEALDAIDSWEEGVEMENREIDQPTELQSLLAEHARILEEILDIRDTAFERD